MKECLICGNQNIKDLERQTLHSDGEGNEGKETAWICKEGKGCC